MKVSCEAQKVGMLRSLLYQVDLQKAGSQYTDTFEWDNAEDIFNSDLILL